MCRSCNGRSVLATRQRKGFSCYDCGGVGARRVTLRYIETCDEEELKQIIADLRELGMFEDEA